jgi:hypothetical protein
VGRGIHNKGEVLNDAMSVAARISIRGCTYCSGPCTSGRLKH